MIAVYLPNEGGVRRSWRDATHRRLISSTQRWQKHNCQKAESTAKHIWAVNTWHSYRSSHGGGQTCSANGCLRVSWRHLSALLPFLDFRSSKSDTENQTVFCNLLWGEGELSLVTLDSKGHLSGSDFYQNFQWTCRWKSVSANESSSDRNYFSSETMFCADISPFVPSFQMCFLWC